MNKEFQTLRKKQRFGLRKLNIGVASVLLGFTIFGYNLASQAPVAHAAATASTGSSGGVVSGSASNSQSSESANSGNATSLPASQAGTVSANHTASSTNTTPSNQTGSVNETTSPATQERTLMMKFPATQSRILMTKFLAAQSQNLIKSVQNSGTDTTLPTTTQTYDKVEQPLLYDYLLHTATGTSDGKTWVDKTVDKGHTIFSPDYRGNTLDTIFGTTSKPGIITSNPDKYFFAAYVDFSEPFHRVILLARSKDLNDKNLYSYTIHTYTQNHSTTTTKPGDSTKEQYTGTGGSTHDLIFQNYDGDSFSVKLNGFEGGYGLLPIFDGGLLDPTYGSNTYDQNNKAAETKSIGFWASAIPQETSTKVRYVDQATGKDIVQPMEISGFGYQGFKVKGEAPTVPGYNLVSKPKFLGLPYEDGTIAPYKVGQTYDLALSDSLVIKQTVIDTDGFVRATAYYKGSPLSTYYKGSALSTSTSKVLGRESDNNSMSFFAPDHQWCTYTNRIGQVDDSYIYYYAKESDPNGSEMRLHFIDVTGVNNSAYAPSDGPELADKVQTIHGKMGNNYIFTYTVPTNYYEVGSSGVTGTYSKTHHDAYVYVKKQAENKLYAPVASDPLTVEQGTTLTTGQAKAAVKYNGDVPSDATYAWDPKTPVDTATVGSYTPNVIVTYGDHTTSSVPVTVNVVAKTDKSNYTVAVGKPVTLTHGQKVKVGDSLNSSAVTLKDAKGQAVSLPDGAKVVWTTAPDTNEVGDAKTGQAKVVYGDKSESEPVTVTYNVTPNDADQYTPTPVTTPIKTNENTTLTEDQAKAAISNNADLPAGTTYTWSTQPDTKKYGDTTGQVTVQYPDNSTKTVTVPVHVNSEAETNQPTLGTPTVDQNGEVDPNSVVTNKDNLPTGTTYSWTKKPNTAKAGQPATGSLHVAYPDGSSKDVPVTVNVKANKDQYTPTPVTTPIKTNENTTLTEDQAKAAISNNADLPAGTTYTWSTQPDTKKYGDTTGQVTVQYPDNSTKTVTVPVHVNSEAETNQPTLGTPTVDQNGEVDPNSVVTNKDNLPTGTTYSWTKKPNTAKAGQPATGSLHVAYPDGSSKDVPVTVNVKANKDQYTPTPVTTPIKTNENTTLTEDQAKAAISNNADLPAGTTYTWSTQPDTKKYGDTTGQVTVQYPDNSTKTVTVPVHVNSEAETNQPTLGTPTVDQNGEVDPNSVVTNKDNLPTGTTYSWTKKPNTAKAGQPATGSLHVAYPDGSSKDVPVTVNVKANKDQYTPTPVTTPIKTNENTTLTEDQAKAAISNNADLPAGTTYTWSTQPDTKKYGDTTGQVTVQYPDNSTKTVTVPVHVNSEAETNQPTLGTPTVDQNGEVDPNSVVTNKDNLPTGTTYSWTKKPNTAKAGQPATGSLHVAYPDGSSKDVPVTVNVKANKDQYTPTPVTTPIKTNENTTLTEDQAKAAISNNADLPAGTTYTWSTQPDTKKYGDTTGQVTVQYPDNSTKTVTVPVHVNSEAETNQPTLGTPTVDQNGEVDPNSVVTNKDNLPTGTTYSWTKKPNTAKAGQPATGSLHVAYPDGSSKDVPVTVNVKANKDQYTPTPVTTPIKTNENTTLTEDQAKAAISNNADLPAGTTYTWSTQPDTKKYGDTTGQVTVQYPDNSTKTVTVPVHVNSEAETNQPTLGTPTVDQNGEVDPNSVVTNKDNLPTGTTYSWTKKPNTAKAGQPATGSLHVAYPDGSSKDVPVTVNVKANKDQYTPTPVTTPIKTNENTTLTEDQAKAAISNNADLPAGTTYTWSTQPDTKKYGDTTGQVTVQYPDNSTKTVTVPVHVNSEAETNQPTLGTPTVDQNGEVDPNSVVTNKDNLPTGTTYSWTKKPNTAKAGQPATGSLHVAYPDGSSKDVPVTVNVKANKDQYTPTPVTTPIKTNENTTLTEDQAKAAISNNADLPAGTTYTWSTQPDTKKYGDTTGQVTVQYPDNSTKTVTVPVHVNSEAETNQPTLGTPTVDQNGEVDPNSVVTNKDNLPTGTTYSWTKKPNTAKAGQPATGSLHVAYPDGSSKDVPVTVNVKANKDQYTPTPVTTPIKTNENTTLTEDQAKAAISNNADLPAGTTYTWSTQPDTKKYGDTTGQVTVQYPDNSTKTVTVPVHVNSEAETNQPTLGTPTVDQNGEVDPNSVVTNKDNLPTGTTYSWTKKPNTAKAGQPATGSLHVAYPDGSSKDVPVTVNVKANKDQYTPTPVTTPIKTNENTTLTEDQAKAAISNNADLPAGTTYTWSTQPDTKKYGDTTGQVTVQYPDNSTKTVTVPVHVNSEAETNQPTLGTPTVDQNGEVDPNSVVTNKDNLPTGTTYSWTKKPNTAKAGQPATGSLHVAYPDGSSKDVPVTVNVKANKDQYTPTPVTTPIKTNENTTLTEDQAKAAISNNADLPAGTTYTWSTQPDTKKYGDTTGQVTVQYPDNSTKTVTVPVHVNSEAETNQPTLGTPTVDQNGEVDPNSVVTNKDNLPTGTTYSWTKKPNTAKAGQPATGSLHVAYPDGSSKDVPVTVNVKANKDQYTPTPVTTPIKTNENTTLTEDQAKAAISNNADLPAGTTYTWSTQPDTKKYGDTTGQVTVQYPDNSTKTVTVPVHVNSEAETNQPTLGTPTVDQNGEVDPNSVVTNKDNLPTGTTYSWTKKPNTAKAGQPATGSLHVAYPDGSSKDVPVTVNVKANKDQYTPTPVTTPIKTNENTTLTEDQAKAAISNNADLPAGTTYTWSTQPDTKKYGDTTGQVTVQYPDNSTKTVTVPVHVNSEAETNQPTLGTPTVDQNGEVDPNSVVTNKDNLPTGTTYSWTKKPNTAKAGQPATGSLHVAYPDGSSKDVPVTVNVKANKDQYTPTPVTTPIKTNENTTLTEDQAKAAISNNADLPAGTTYTWSTQPDTKKYGDTTGQVTVQYPDNSTKTVTVPVHVNSEAETNQPTLGTPTVDQNGEVDPNSVVTNKDNLPTGTTYSWTKKPNTAKAGQPATGSLHVAYPDGSSKDVPVTVNVKANKDQYTPTPVTTPIKTNENTTLTEDQAKAAISNNADLPAGTTYTWSTQPDTKKYGDTTGQVTVQYPDNSTKTVTVPVHVNSEAETNQPTLGTPTVDQNGEVDPNSVVTNKDNLPTGTTYSWTKKPNTAKAGQPATGSLHVAYPDGSSKDVPVTVNVKANKDQYTPTPVTTPIKTNENTTLTEDQAKAAISNNADLPAGTTYTWSTQPDTKKYGDTTGQVTVQYPDNSTKTVTVPVHVNSEAETNQPTLGTPTVDQNGEVDPNSVVTNKDNLPTGTTYSWTKKPNTAKAGQPATGSLHVAYPDGSSKDVPVTVNVKANKDQYTPTPVTTPIKTNENTTLTEDQAKAAISNNADLPAGTTYTWSTQPDTKKYGDTTGQVTVQYPDNSTKTVTVPVHVNSEAETNQPTLGTPTVDQNGEVDPNSVVTNKDNLPTGTTYSWTKKPNTAKAGQPATGSLHVAYPDGSSKDVPVTVNVKANKDQYTPTPVTTPIKTNENTTLTEDQAKAAISNNADLPAGTTYTWSTQPDTKKYGDTTGQVTVQYPDNSTKTVTVPVHVNSEAETNQPTLGTPTVDQNGEVDPNSVVTNKDNLPTGTTYSWTKKPNTAKAGQPATGSLHVAYPDGSSKDVPVTVNVKANKDQYTPTPVTTPIKTNENTTLTEDQAKAAISNNADLPAGTTYTWSTQPDTKKYGDTTGQVTVQYPDNSTKTVTVPVHVNSEAETNQPTLGTPTVDQNGEVDPNSVVTNKDNLPTGTTYSWTKKPNTAKAGQPATGSLHVAYPDGSSKDVPVTVNVKANKDQYTPTPVTTPIKTNENTTLTEDQAKAAISNNADLPAGTTYTWSTQPDTKKYGDTTGQVTVQYPDNSTKTVTVPVHVNSEAETNQPTLGTPTVDQNGEVDPNSVVTNKDNLPTGTTYSWTKKPNTAKAGQPATGSLHVAYPDGSSKDVPVTVNVKANKDQYTPTVDQNAPVEPNSVVTNQDKLPKGTTYSWTTQPNTAKAGQPAKSQAKTLPQTGNEQGSLLAASGLGMLLLGLLGLGGKRKKED